MLDAENILQNSIDMVFHPGTSEPRGDQTHTIQYKGRFMAYYRELTEHRGAGT